MLQRLFIKNGRNIVLFYKTMPKTRQEKEVLMKEVTELFQKAPLILFTHFTGITVNDVNDLRQRCKARGVEYKVVKKTLLDRICKDQQFPVVPTTLEGEIATVFSLEDEIAAAQLLCEFQKKHEAIKLVCGVLEGKYLQAFEVSALASLPSREQLVARAVGSIRSPLSRFLTVLSGNLRGLVCVLNRIGEQKSSVKDTL